MVYPLKLMVPLFVRLLITQLPVRFQVLPFSMVITALSDTAVHPSSLSTTFTVPPTMSDQMAADELSEVVTVRLLAFVVPPPVV